MSDRSTRTRHALRSCFDAGVVALPYAFAASGLALGAGALIADSPLTGACGAVAGVTGGLLAISRSRFHHRQVVALRERLRKQRTTSNTAMSGLRARISALEVSLWERQVLAPMPVEPAIAEPVAAPVAEPPAEVAVEPDPVAEPVAEPAPSGRPGIRLAYAAAQITVPRTVLAAAVATTGSLSLADIAAAAERKAVERQQSADAEAEEQQPDLDEATTAA